MNNRWHLVFFYCVVMLFSTCSKDDGGIEKYAGRGNVSFKIDGVPSTINAQFFAGHIPYPIITVTGQSVNVKQNTSLQLSLAVVGDTIGRYEISSSPQFAVATITLGPADNTSFYRAESGNITIAKLDTAKGRITGTFNFDVFDNVTGRKTITNGVFTDVPAVPQQ